MSLRVCLLAILSTLAVAPAALAGQSVIAGQASVIDGDTIEIHGARIRLHGIDAPESRQLCYRGNQAIRCGQQAAFFLADQLENRVVECAVQSTDRYGRAIARCSFGGGKDIGEMMVETGQAVAYRRYAMDYVAAETGARGARAGIWSTDFDMPWDWRRRQ